MTLSRGKSPQAAKQTPPHPFFCQSTLLVPRSSSASSTRHCFFSYSRQTTFDQFTWHLHVVTNRCPRSRGQSTREHRIVTCLTRGNEEQCQNVCLLVDLPFIDAWNESKTIRIISIARLCDKSCSKLESLNTRWFNWEIVGIKNLQPWKFMCIKFHVTCDCAINFGTSTIWSLEFERAKTIKRISF